MRQSVLMLSVLCFLSAAVTASSQSGGASQAPVQNPPLQERKEITVAESVLKTYVGQYELVPEENLTITFEKGSLWGQLPGSSVSCPLRAIRDSS